MSNLKQLIRELCPEEVEYIRLGDKDIFDFHYGKGNSIPENKGGKYPVYGCNGVVSYTESYNCENVSIIGHIGSAGIINRCYGKCYVTYNGTIADVVDENRINKQYFYYILTILDLPTYVKGSQPFLSVSDFEKLQIPIPPIKVQEEIVRILDTFTELTAELTARKKQYNYYRDKLLTFEDGQVEWKTLGEIADIGVGNKPIVIDENINNYEYINAGTTKSGYCSDFNCEGDTVTTPSRGQGGIGFVGFQKNKFWLGPLCYKIRAKKHNSIITKYLYYFLQENNNLILSLKKEGGVPAVNRADLIKLNIPYPSLEEQKHIVSILDKFDALTSSITEGLPREIELRQKQYEYYRNMLLSFPKEE